MTTQKEQPGEIEYWRYAGRRESKNGKLIEAWSDKDGNILAFPRSKGAGYRVIGAVYQVRVTRSEGTVILHGNPSYLGPVQSGTDWWQKEDKEEDIRVWTIEDSLAENEIERKRAEKRAAERGGLGVMTLDQLRVQLRKLLPHQRRAMLVIIQEYLR